MHSLNMITDVPYSKLREWCDVSLLITRMPAK